MTHMTSNKVKSDDYPEWYWYPASAKPSPWAPEFVSAVRSARARIDSGVVDGLTSDIVLAQLRDGLVRLGFQVESSKVAKDRIRRPVLFGTQGAERVAYEVDGVHDANGIILEVEAARGARGNAVYRDIIRASLIVDARYLVLGVMRTYRHRSGDKDVSVTSFKDAKDVFDAIYASGRLKLPFDGVLLFGY
jgi:hypothetical protein